MPWEKPLSLCKCKQRCSQGTEPQAPICPPTPTSGLYLKFDFCLKCPFSPAHRARPCSLPIPREEVFLSLPSSQGLRERAPSSTAPPSHPDKAPAETCPFATHAGCTHHITGAQHRSKRAVKLPILQTVLLEHRRPAPPFSSLLPSLLSHPSCLFSTFASKLNSAGHPAWHKCGLSHLTNQHRDLNLKSPGKRCSSVFTDVTLGTEDQIRVSVRETTSYPCISTAKPGRHVLEIQPCAQK